MLRELNQLSLGPTAYLVRSKNKETPEYKLHLARDCVCFVHDYMQSVVFGTLGAQH